MRISLSSYPSPQKTYTADFPKLTGGLNLWELDYRMDADQSPNMKNLWWQDGLLQCRDGQRYLSEQMLGEGYTCFEGLFHGQAFFHIGTSIFYGNPKEDPMALHKLGDGIPGSRGSFFRYQDWLFYKNRGGFYRITHREDGFLLEEMTQLAYTPVVAINCHPDTGSGDLYQPENRLSPLKTVRYNAAKDVKEYHLPITEISGIERVEVDGTLLEEGDGYTVELQKGLVVFYQAPAVTDPPTNNTVSITYRKENPEAMASVMDCPYALVSGGDRQLCILLAGSTAQPNAVFWNSNDNLAMNPGYFPISYYNLVGDTQDPVTGFGRQYGDTIVFKERSVGRLEFGLTELEGRDSLSFTYTAINSRVGCDLPWSIQLIENNLVFCNTAQGVHIIRSSSAAYENNVESISRNINGRAGEGLLSDLQDSRCVTSFDDGDRYWLCVDGRVYLWDYVLSPFSDPSWFLFTAIPAVAFFQDSTRRLCHLDRQGRVTRFERVFSDYEQGIEKVYQFPTCHFGTYHRLKDVTDILVAVRSDTDTDITITYSSDYETRQDRTLIRSYSWRLSPRNLSRRYLGISSYAHVVRRKPGCRHIRHFSMTFSNDTPGSDLAVVSAQIHYKFQEKER